MSKKDKKKKERPERPKRVTIRHKLRLRMRDWMGEHQKLFTVLDYITWALSAVFVLAFLTWLHDHPYPWAIGLGLLVLLFKLLLIVIDPNRELKEKD